MMQKSKKKRKKKNENHIQLDILIYIYIDFFTKTFFVITFHFSQKEHTAHKA